MCVRTKMMEYACVTFVTLCEYTWGFVCDCEYVCVIVNMCVCVFVF